jgi:glycosyltransferase involved in cell wall biosynthesis
VVLPSAGSLADDLRAAGVEVIVHPLAVLRRELMNPAGASSVLSSAARDAISLSRLVRRRGVVLIHSNTSVVLSGWTAAATARVPHVWHVREIYIGFGRVWPGYRQLLATAAALPCVSAATAEQFAGGSRSTRSRTRVIYDGLAVDASRAPRAAARTALQLPPEVPVIAMLGRISTWKGQDLLVRALARPALAEVGALALIAGDAWQGAEHRREVVVELASRLGVADRVRLVGFRDDVENVYGAADLIAVPSTAPDPLPGAAIEAAAAGCAVLAAAHGGLPEIVTDRVTGRLFAPGDDGALARAARELLDDPAQRDRLGAAAAADVTARFAPARLLELVQRCYDDVLGA